jgi:hypothetical protein
LLGVAEAGASCVREEAHLLSGESLWMTQDDACSEDQDPAGGVYALLHRTS